MHHVYGSMISYYTGKLETYLRMRGIEYDLRSTFAHEKEILEGAGAMQMPILQLDDGRWTSDTTPILAYLDGQRNDDEPSIFPEDDALRFLALLIEDYADEWLWRSAMHYRWSYRMDRDHASGLLADEHMPEVPLPRRKKKLMIMRRQRVGFVWGDGLRATTWDHVEQGYFTALDCLEEIFSERRFILGDRPTIADFGFMGPMLRHFGQDPTPAEIMRTRAPRVFAWVARMWNIRSESQTDTLIDASDASLATLLAELSQTHLVNLRQNASAYALDKTRADQTIQGCQYPKLPVSRYRVWCLETLRQSWADLPENAKATLRPLLTDPGAEILWDETGIPASHYNDEGNAPFNQAINVFGTGIPD